MDSPRILILGSFSGRNAGDAALLFQIADDFGRHAPHATLLVPTMRPAFLRRNLDQLRVKPVPIMPWNLSIKFLGLPLWKAVRQSRLALITDNILFDRGIYNPLYNYVPGLAWTAALCRRYRVPLVGYNLCAGPFTKRIGMALARYIAQTCDRIYVREQDSYDLLRGLGASPEKLSLAADSAFALKGAGEERGRKILREAFGDETGPWIGLNLCSYLGVFLGASLDREEFIKDLAKAADGLLEAIPARLAVVTTQVMDIPFAREVMQQMKRKDEVRLITNENLSCREIMAVDSCFDLFFGMRLHSLILCSAAGTPAIGIAYAPKVASYMRQMGLESWTVDLLTFDPKSFSDLAARAWSERSSLRERVRERVGRLHEGKRH